MRIRIGRAALWLAVVVIALGAQASPWAGGQTAPASGSQPAFSPESPLPVDPAVTIGQLSNGLR